MALEFDTLPKYLQRNRWHFGDQVAAREKDYGIWKPITWKDVYEETKYFALGLVSMGLKKGDKVCLLGNNEPELYWAEYATLCAGGVVLCIFADCTPREVEYQIADAEVVLAVVEDQEQVDKLLEIKGKLPTSLKKVIYWDSRGMWRYDDPILTSFRDVQELGKEYDQQNPEEFERLIEMGESTNPAILLYTSGSTGQQKGVLWTYENLFDYVSRYQRGFPRQFRAKTEYLTFISPAWMLEQTLGVTLGVIVPMIVNFPEEPETVSQNIREIAPEIIVLGPRQWENLISIVQARMLDASWIHKLFYNVFMFIGRRTVQRQTKERRIGPVLWLLRLIGELLLYRPLKDKLGLIRLKLALTGGVNISPEIFMFCHSIGVQLRSAYGITEVGFLTGPRDGAIDFETVGQPFQPDPRYGSLEIRISDNEEILCRGGSGFLGYYHNPEETAQVLDVEGWYHTGDAGHLTETGHLVILDRISDLKTLSSGTRFSPQSIEVRLRHSPYIKDTIVVGQGKEYVGAVIDIDPETIERWAEKYHITYSTFPELSQKVEVRELIREEISKVNSSLPPEWRVKRFFNLAKPFDADEGDLTRTWKLRRGAIEDRYQNMTKYLYSNQEEYLADTPVKYRDGRTGVLSVTIKITDVG